MIPRLTLIYYTNNNNNRKKVMVTLITKSVPVLMINMITNTAQKKFFIKDFFSKCETQFPNSPHFHYTCFHVTPYIHSPVMALFPHISMAIMTAFPGTSLIIKKANWVE